MINIVLYTRQIFHITLKVNINELQDDMESCLKKTRLIIE